jgi:hypothetical protein
VIGTVDSTLIILPFEASANTPAPLFACKRLVRVGERLVSIAWQVAGDDGVNAVWRNCELPDDCRYVDFAKTDTPLVLGVNVRVWQPKDGAYGITSRSGQRRAGGPVRVRG